METGGIPTTPVSNWQPITNKFTLAVLGKLGEEANELGAIICRCIIQGLDEREPETGKVNRLALAQEIADVIALADIAVRELRLDVGEIEERSARKVAYKQPWFDALRAQTRG